MVREMDKRVGLGSAGAETKEWGDVLEKHN